MSRGNNSKRRARGMARSASSRRQGLNQSNRPRSSSSTRGNRSSSVLHSDVAKSFGKAVGREIADGLLRRYGGYRRGSYGRRYPSSYSRRRYPNSLISCLSKFGCLFLPIIVIAIIVVVVYI